MTKRTEATIHRIGIKEAEKITGINRVTIYRMMKQGRFPKGPKVLGRHIWDRDDVIGWYEQHAEA